MRLCGCNDPTDCFSGLDVAICRAKSLQELGCTFPECLCKVPDFAFSDHNRRKYCQVYLKLTED